MTHRQDGEARATQILDYYTKLQRAMRNASMTLVASFTGLDIPQELISDFGSTADFLRPGEPGTDRDRRLLVDGRKAFETPTAEPNATVRALLSNVSLTLEQLANGGSPPLLELESCHVAVCAMHKLALERVSSFTA